ncbi:MAG TPA: hypothetical protein VGO25_10930 [Rhodanobacteraceae bacterium]|jgi:hypothetical protein|nr:hypothetical protein [Rhodanobacteraceae bacterium]
MDVDACMTWISRTARFVVLPAVLLLFATATQAAQGDPWDGSVHTDLTFYGWLPGVDGDLRFELPNGGRAETKSSNNILDNLEGALMVQTVVRAGDWGFFGDLDWVKFGNQKGRFTHIGGDVIGGDLNLDTRWNVKGGMLTLAALYTLGHGSWGSADALFGGRYLWIKGNLSWDFSGTGNDGFQIDNSGHIAQNSHVTDAVIGLRGRLNLGDGSWYVPYYFDVGAGSDSRTAQAVVGIGYGFDWGGLSFLWRHTAYSQSNDSDLIRRIAFDGPAFAATWSF